MVLKELDAPVYRWPGGNFVSGYDWKDGIGDRDRRPPRKNPAWSGIEANDFGIDEFLAWIAPVHPELAAIGRGDVRFFHAGLLPVDRPGATRPRRHYTIERRPDRSIHVRGVKYTAAYGVAAEAVGQAAGLLGRSGAGNGTDDEGTLIDHRPRLERYLDGAPGRRPIHYRR